jgi:hypothetical protein
LRLVTAERSSGALWFVAVIFALGTVFPSNNGFLPSGYVASDISAAGIGLAYNGPLLAGFAAFWGRGRARFHRTLRSDRSGLACLFGLGWPILIGGPIAGVAAVLVTARTIPTDMVSWELLAMEFAVLLACGSLGIVLSWALPVVIAVPASVVACFIWINYLPATNSALLHNMSPPVDGFAQASEPATPGLLAVLILTLGICVGAGACVGRRRWDRTPRLLAVPIALIVPALAVALSAASLMSSRDSLNLLVAQQRMTPLICSDHQGIEVCLWPEGTERAKEIAALAVTINESLDTWGLPAITAIGQGGQVSGAVEVETLASTSAVGMQYSISLGYLRQQLGCQDAGGPAVEERVALLAMASGVPQQSLAANFTPELLRVVTDVLQDPSPPNKVGHWYMDGLSKIRCVSAR